ncbi:hypothetical protein CB1_000459011 [Camelus ferus]|nr:hypothetical protein CB1_000459011 [Camelus ferus]
MHQQNGRNRGNVLPLWGNEKTMNLNPMILTNILSSPYFKVQLYELKTYHEVVDEIYFKVTHVEPWEKGSRKTAGQTGMCGGDLDVKAGGGCVMTIGEMLRSFLTKLEWFSTLFPRIPVPVQKNIDQQIKTRPRKIKKDGKEGAEEIDRHVERRRSRSPRRSLSPRRSPRRSRSRSHHREGHGSSSFDRELEREKERQRLEREAKEREKERRRSRSIDRGLERRHSRSRERHRSRSRSRDRKGDRRDRDREREKENERGRRRDRDYDKERGNDREKERSRERSKERRSRGEIEEKKHKEDKDDRRHRDDKKDSKKEKKHSRSRSRERKHRSRSRSRNAGKRSRSRSREKSSKHRNESKEKSNKRSRSGSQGRTDSVEKSRKREHSPSKEKSRKRSRSKERSHKRDHSDSKDQSDKHDHRRSQTPQIPTIDQAYSKISNSITVEWATVPGATSYLLTAKDGNTVIETMVANSPGTVTGLKAATLYQITVRSISATGRSQASPPKQAKTVLAAPILEVSSPSPDSILVQWEAVYMAMGFSVSIMRANGLGRIWKENTTNTSLTFSSLDAGTLYTIKAYAWNANGTPGDDSTCNQRTKGAFNYTVMALSDSSKLSCSTTISSCTISSLQCGTEYLISVLASNDAGSSKSASAVTLKTVACAPGRVTIQEDRPGHLYVAWSDVELGDYYVAFVKSDDGLEVHCNTSLTQCNFLSECGFTYFISVFAYNKAGQSPLGDVFNYTTAPCCPSDINPVLVSSDRVEIVWSPVRGAELYETKAVDGFNVVECNDTAPACTLSALECDTGYNITVYSFSEVRGSNLSCTSRFITTAPCSPEIKNVSKDAFSAINVRWRPTNDDATYTVTAQGGAGLYRCSSAGESCALGGLPCGSVFSVSAVAETRAGRSPPSYSVPLETGACCPLGVKLYRLGPNGIRIHWQASRGSANYSIDLYGSKGIFTCAPSAGLSFCDVTEIPCGDVYTVYTLDVPDAFYYCYSPDPSNANGKDVIMEAMAEQIVTVCATLDENPGVRYKRYKTDGKEKEAVLEEDDDLWVRIRHRHIAVVLEEIPKLMKEISSTKKATEGKISLSALTQLMKKMPHFRKQITKQVVHLNLAEDCMSKFKPNIEKLCKTEQDLALGTDAEGQKVKDSMRVLLPVLLNKNHDNYDKIRAILLYIFSINGTTEENLDRLIQNVKLENESDMIRNWSYLGVPIVPPDAIDNRLDSKEWPYCSQCPAVWNGSGAVSARQKPRANYLEDRKNGSKLIVFVIGGITYSEMRCAYEVSQAYKSCEVIIGSTHILTPKKLLDDIKMLNKPKDKVSFIKDE